MQFNKTKITIVSICLIIIAVLYLYFYRAYEKQKISTVQPWMPYYQTILNDEKLITKYKSIRHYLDDMFFYPIDASTYFHEVGYSKIWNVLSVTVQDSFETKLYIDVPEEIWKSFLEQEFSLSYFEKTIENTYPCFEYTDMGPELVENYVIMK